MLLSLSFILIICFMISIVIVGAIGRTDGTIARVLYEAEHQERRR
jgi:hypothetical protein